MRALTAYELDLVAGGLMTGSTDGSGGGGSGDPPPSGPIHIPNLAPEDHMFTAADSAADLQAFFDSLTATVAGSGGGSDQNSGYDEGENYAPFDMDSLFMESFGWMPAVQAMPETHYWDFLTAGTDPEFLLDSANPTTFSGDFHHAGSSATGHAIVSYLSDTQAAFNINGIISYGTFHPGPDSSTGSGTVDDPVVVTAGGGYWTFTTTPSIGMPPPPPEFSGGGGIGGGAWTPPTTPPAGWNAALDAQIDHLAAQISAEIAALPDSDHIEHGAFIWKDGNGVLHRTALTNGDASHAWLTDADFAALGIPDDSQIIAIIHNHPTRTWNPGQPSIGVPGYWQNAIDPAANAKPSGADFTQWYNQYVDKYHVDASNFRAYMVYAGQVHEYDLWQQDASQVGAGYQATWAVESSSYHP